MNDETLARVRERIRLARQRAEWAPAGRGAPMVADVLDMLPIAEALLTMIERRQPRPDGTRATWWAMRERGEGWCLFCGATVDLYTAEWSEIRHEDTCTAMVIQSAIVAAAGGES